MMPGYQRDGSEDRPCRGQGTGELEAITGIGVVVTFVIHPAHAEGELTFGLHHAIEKIQLLILGMRVIRGSTLVRTSSTVWTNSG